MFYVDQFVDSNTNTPMNVHPNTFLVDATMFRTTGMYDEDFAGNYGYEDLYLPYVWEHYGGMRQIFGKSAYFADQHFKTSNLNRSTEINKELALSKINDGIKKPINLIRFQWKKY